MTWYDIDTWTVIIAALCAVACALPGCFLVLRGMSMMGDAISHAVLPGLALAFIFTGQRDSLVMFLAAAITGVLTAVFTQWISTFGRVDRGAAMGIVFTTLFACGLLLISHGAEHVELDPSCVLFGALELTPLDTQPWTIFGTTYDIPQAASTLGAVLLINLVLIVVFFKELTISSFDAALATTSGFSATLMHYLLMSLVAITTVAAFEAVGSIIVIAMLIAPPATAYLLTKNLKIMLLISAAIGSTAAIAGHTIAISLPLWLPVGESSTTGMIATVCGILFAFAWIFSPYDGLYKKLFHQRNAKHTQLISEREPHV